MDATKYNPIVAWRSKLKNVRLNSAPTINNPATFKLTIEIEDTQEIGSGIVDDTMYVTDFVGVPYKITTTTGLELIVSDEFRTNQCPTSGRTAYIHKSAYKGQSLYLPSFVWRHLHPIAESNNNKYQMAILWNNDPNPRRFEFTNVDEPKIENYQGIQIDGTKLSEDYGEMPKVKLFLMDNEGGLIERTERPYFTFVDNKIDVITFGVLDQSANWIIEISR